jgi:glycosyltransferase involved in cell wall biosynthesis
LCEEHAFVTNGRTETALVVPCYNEAQRLPAADFGAFLRDAADVCLVFVDDGSTDRTPERLIELAAAGRERVEVLSLPANVGKAEAVRAGMLRALELEPSYVGYWDADLATPLPALHEFRAVLEQRPEVELVLGSRVVLLGRQIERRAFRHYLGRASATLIALMLGLRVYDSQCGAKLFRATPTLHWLLAEPFVSRWIFDVEILARMVEALGGPEVASRAIREYPLEEWRDVPGSKVSLADYLRAGADLVRIGRRRLRSKAAAPPPAR